MKGTYGPSTCFLIFSPVAELKLNADHCAFLDKEKPLKNANDSIR